MTPRSTISNQQRFNVLHKEIDEALLKVMDMTGKEDLREMAVLSLSLNKLLIRIIARNKR